MSRPRSRTRGNPPRPAEVDLRRQAAGGWQDSVRLQHPEGVHPPLGSSSRMSRPRSRTRRESPQTSRG